MSEEIIKKAKNLNNKENTPSQNEQNANTPPKNKNNTISYIPFTKKRRVKLYILNDNGQWDDKGVGYVFCANETEVDNQLNGGMQNSNQLIKKLIMTKEKTDEIIFNIDIIKENINFHNQRGTILTWKNGGLYSQDNYAISFQEKDGVLEILKNIKIINGKNVSEEDDLIKDESSDILLDVSIENLPNLIKEFGPNMDEQKLSDFVEYLKETNFEFIKNLGKILDEEEKRIEDVKSCASYSSLETNITLTLKKDNNSNESIKETNNSINNKKNNKTIVNENIIYIYNIFKNLILIGDKELLELLLDDECYLITFRAFEHDIQTNKIVPHRKYFKEIVKFKNPLNIKNTNLLKKINQNLRLFYLRDTALSRIIDDNTTKTINTIIQMNHNDIIQFFINNKEYIDLLYLQLKSEDIIIQNDAILFLSELISCSKNVAQSRVTFNELLCDNGILPILNNLIENNLKNEENNKYKEEIIINTVEIFISILSSVPFLIREYLRENDGHTLLQLSNLLIYHTNFGIKYEVSQIFKTLIESEGEPYDKKLFFKSIIEKFMNFLFFPELENKNEISTTIQIIIEIIMSWINNMGFDSQFWLEKFEINLAIIKLFKEKNKIINLYAIKLLKVILENSEHYICNKILTNELCKVLIDLFNENIKKNNIIFSCLMNLFDSIIKNDIYILNIIMNYSSDFFYNNKDLFKNILLRYEGKQAPKKKMLSYLNLNSITETSFKDIEPLYRQNIENEKVDENNEIHYNGNYSNYYKSEDEEDEFNILNKLDDIFYIENNRNCSDDRVEFLCKKRNAGKKNEYEENDDCYESCSIENVHLNRRLNNYHGYKNLDNFRDGKLKQKEYVGLSLKETEIDDNIYNIFNEDEDLF